MPGLRAASGTSKVLLVAGVSALIAALVVTLVVVRLRSSDKQQSQAPIAPPATGDRLLQSVNATMGADGALSQVGGTVVISRAGGGQAETETTTYDPSKVVDQLPVRVVPSYRTATSSGTNLADLKGYTGRVTIDLTVQNLTVAPQQVSYNSDGQSHTTTAMVGAPLTVVASASLPGVSPASVVTADKDTTSDETITNGVLSRAADQTTQVQWATILAPPQLSSTAKLQLVMDAKNFAVPTVDVSVQPGLVTDPSVGALVDAAFNPKNSEELALVSRTIQVIGDVNDVLGRASTQITRVRKTLDTTSQTLGTKTVVELQQNTKQISGSLKESDQNLDSLNKALQTSLKSTSSSTLQKLSDTVSQVDALLGDTSQPVPTPSVSGSGCEAKVSGPQSGASVYASLLQVTAQLNTYAKTTRDCKVELQKSISDTIGPADPTKSGACPDDASVVSVTCSLEKVRGNFVDVVKDIVAAQAASATLNPEQDFADTRKSVSSLEDQLAAIVKSTDALLATDPAATDPQLAKIADQLDAAKKSLTDSGTAIDGIKTSVGTIHTDAVTSQTQAAAMVKQNADLVTALCQAVTDGALTPDRSLLLLAYLTPTGCDGKDLPVTPGLTPMSDQLQKQADAWQKLVDSTDTAKTDDGLGKLLDQAATGVTDASTAVGKASTELDAGTATVKDVNTNAKAALDALKTLDTGLGTIQTNYTAAKATLDAALKDAHDKASDVSSTNLDSAIAQISQQGQASSAQLGTAFENSAAGLESAALALQNSGTKAITQQRSVLIQTKKDATASLSAATSDSLDQISGSVTSASRDLGSTRTQLTTDLGNILLDLGNPNVRGSGVIGTVKKGADAAGSADYQLALASDQTSSYAAVRGQDVAGIMLRQAQAEAALAQQAKLPAFELQLPDGVQHRSVYSFHLAGG